MNNIKQILKSNKNVKKHPVEYFENIMTHMLSVGTPYSSFIEILLCNMFLVNKDMDNKQFWRYHNQEKAVQKFGDKTLAKNISPLLGCLFTPNKTTLQNINSFEDVEYDRLSVHERIWMGKYK